MRFCYDDVGYMLWKMGYRAINKQVESDIAEMLEDVDEGKEKDFLHHLINTVAYWFIDEEEEQRAYEEENIPKLNEFFNKHLAGKSWDDIKADDSLMSDWGFYSDWYKDCYGFRPHIY